MKVLIDADILIYKIGFASQHAYYDWYHPDDIDGETSRINEGAVPIAMCENAKEAKAWLAAAKAEGECPDYVRVQRDEIEPLENCLHSANLVMDKIVTKYGWDDVWLYFSCSTPDNWRTKFYPEYKANRKPRKPHWGKELLTHLKGKWPSVTGGDVEADDLIATVAFDCNHMSESYVVVTIDKDMDQIPGLHYNWVKDLEYWVNQGSAYAALQIQRIMGDSTDNIKGIPGWGEVKAIKWIMEYMDGGDAVRDAFASVYPNEAEAKWHEFLTCALVTLPCTDEHRARLEEEVAYAWQEFQATAPDSNTAG